MADITPGYSFISGETNVDHTKLNTCASGNINTTFHTGKGSVAANPNTGTTELMVYDSAAAVFKKGSLSSLVMDHTSLLAARSAKTAPVAADVLLVSDSAASGAYKSMSAANLLFGAAVHGYPPVAGDKLGIYDSVGLSLRQITLGNLFSQATSLSSVDGAETSLVLTNAGALRRTTLANIIENASAATGLSGLERVSLSVSGVLKKSTMSALILNQATNITVLDGLEEVLANIAGGASTGRMSSKSVKKYVHAGYALYRDEKAQNSAGGTLTAGSWGTRTMNTESVDTTLAGASVATNKVTLPAGTFRFRCSAPFYRVGNCQVRLQNTSDATTVAAGTSQNSGNSATGAVTRSEVTGRFTIAATKDFELQYQIGASVGTSDGGVPANFTTEVYSTMEFWQED